MLILVGGSRDCFEIDAGGIRDEKQQYASRLLK